MRPKSSKKQFGSEEGDYAILLDLFLSFIIDNFFQNLAKVPKSFSLPKTFGCLCFILHFRTEYTTTNRLHNSFDFHFAAFLEDPTDPLGMKSVAPPPVQCLNFAHYSYVSH